MKRLKPSLVILTCVLFTVLEIEAESQLDELLKEIKEQRINLAKHELSDGVYWLNGYLFNKEFYPCRKINSFKIIGWEMLSESTNPPTLVYVEATTKVENSHVTLVERHYNVEGSIVDCEMRFETH